MEKFTEAFVQFYDDIIEAIPNFTVAVLIFLLFLFLGIIFGRIINRRYNRKWKDNLVALFISRFVKWSFITVGIIFGLHIMNLGGVAGGLMAGAGISAIILGFAFKDIVENFLSGILLAVNRPFKVGDIIEIDGFKGPVKKLDLRSTHIRTADGRDIYIPNANIVKGVLINFTKDGLIRHEFNVGLETDTDINAVRNLILNYFTNDTVVLKNPAPSLIVHEIGESAIVVKIFFWMDMFKKNTAEKSDNINMGSNHRSRVMQEITSLLLENGFTLPAIIVEHKMNKMDDNLNIKVTNS